jgi:hypothetical protein
MSRTPKVDDAPRQARRQRGVEGGEHDDASEPMTPDRKHGLEDLDVTGAAPPDVERRDTGRDPGRRGG